MISEEKNRDFLIIDQMGIGEKGGVFDFTDELEVNGNVKVKDLRVEGNVTFAGNHRLVMHLSIRLPPTRYNIWWYQYKLLHQT